MTINGYGTGQRLGGVLSDVDMPYGDTSQMMPTLPQAQQPGMVQLFGGSQSTPSTSITSPYIGGTSWYDSPSVAVNTQPITSYTPKYESGSAIGQLINQYGQNLSPQEAFTSKVSYSDFAAPQREVYNQWVKNVFQPEFERKAYSPFRRGYASQAASTGMSQMGGAKRRYEDARNELLRESYYNPLESAQSTWEDMMRNAYEKRLQRYYESPTSFTNIAERRV